jgi:predicted nucleic acid-binding protein
MIIDTNILIYATKPSGTHLREWVEHAEATVSILSRIEALGFSKISLQEKVALEAAFACLPEAGLTDAIATRAIGLLQDRKMGLADAVIAATALQHSCPLVTRNVDDFKNIPGLVVIDPFCRV